MHRKPQTSVYKLKWYTTYSRLGYGSNPVNSHETECHTSILVCIQVYTILGQNTTVAQSLQTYKTYVTQDLNL